jgi:hypothetical protein
MSSLIVIHETAHANLLGSQKKIQLPIPDEKTRVCLESKGVLFGDKIDKVLQNATIPENWIMKPHSLDHRTRILYDDQGKEVAQIFIKNSGYDYYGWIYLF